MNYLKISDATVKMRTGNTWAQWFKILDKWKAKDKGHYETAKHLGSKYQIPGWWAQVVTVRYEKEKVIGQGMTKLAK